MAKQGTILVVDDNKAVLNAEDNLTNFGLVAAGGVVSVIPITLFVIFAQNYLISGLSSGAVKE